MKIGIVTHHWVPNFGANLQAYAAQELFKYLGHDVIFVNFRPKYLIDLYKKTVSNEQQNAHENFVRNNFKQTEIVTTNQEFLDLMNAVHFDVLIAGSDAILRVSDRIVREDFVFPNPYWMATKSPKNPGMKKCFLSASSMGFDYKILSSRTKKGIKKSLEELDFVSVRDSWTKRQLQVTGFKGNIKKTPDPVFFMNEFKKNFGYDFDGKAKFLVMSTSNTFGERWNKSFYDIATSHGYKVLGLPTPEGQFDLGLVDRIDLPLDPGDWAHILSECSGYVGARFHPVVVSTVSRVPIVSIDKYHKGILDRKRSKNFDVMKDFSMSKYCLGRKRIRHVAPGTVFKLLTQQQPDLAFREKKAKEWRDLLVDIWKNNLQNF